jgi:hypothetical protein
VKAEDIDKASDEQLARAVLLWAGHGDPHGMHLVMSPSFPGHETFIKNLAAFGRRPDIAAQLPGPEVLAFFQELSTDVQRKLDFIECIEGASEDMRQWAQQQADEKMKEVMTRCAAAMAEDVKRMRGEVEDHER